MRTRILGGAIGITAALVAASLAGAPANGAKAQPVNPTERTQASRSDNLPNPLGDAQATLKKEAINRIVSGEATAVQRNGSEVVSLGRNKWVELKKKADKVDPVFTVLAQFGTQIHPAIGGTPGPGHNQIPEPDRTENNSTYWEPDFNQAHFDKMYNGPGESMSDFYYQQSGGKYSVKATVSDWVQLSYNEARYGSNNFSETSTYWPFVRDTANAWYASQVAAGKTSAEISAYLAQFDVYDRYDFDGDGNFNEPDGYIDHYQAVHAGEGEEAGGGAQGDDAIWSHRWYAYSNAVGSQGPAGNQLGGTQIGTSGIWVGDYTVQPENGGLGVFAHEFGHDLGLPDLYDTAGGDNSTAFWTLMSGGSWMSHSNTNIGTSPIHMGPWEKMVLGWLDYTTVGNDTTRLVTLGSAASQALPQAVLVPLPEQTISTDWNTPHSGSYEWWGSSADDLNTTLVRDVNLTGSTTATLKTFAQYEIEEGYDYLYGEVSTNGGSTWTTIGDGLDGSSAGAWTELSYDLSNYAGQQIKFRFRYQTDGGVHLDGPFLDDISLVTDGPAAFSDDVEAGVGAWTASGGFTRFTGSSSRTAAHFYLAENRTYTGYDKSFQVGPYNFGFNNTKPDWVEKFPYQDGLLVWYVNYAYDDNNTSAHPGGGLALPVDARPAPIVFPGACAAHGGNPNGLCMLGNRRQPFDATFGTQATDAVTFHRLGVPVTVPAAPGITTFDDTNPSTYWSASNPWNSVKVAGEGTKISVWLELQGPLPVMLLEVKN